MLVGLHVLGHGLARRRQRHLLESLVLRTNTSVHSWLHANINLIAAEFCRIKQLWLVNEVVIKHGIHALCWHFVISELHILCLVLVVDGLESAEVLNDSLAIGLLLRRILIVVPFQLRLPWLENRVRLVAVGVESLVPDDVVQHI